MDLLKVISNYFVMVLGILAFLGIWGFSILTVYAGTTRRSLPFQEKYFWIALVTVLPVVGFAIYLLSGLALRIINTEPRLEVAARRDSTEYAPSEDWLNVMPPIPAAAAPVKVETIPPPAAPSRAHCFLTALEGPSQGARFPVEQFPVRIGRGDAITVNLGEDMRVSRQHAEIYQQDGAIYVRDLGSLHGTTVNGKPAGGQPLQPGDHIVIGETVLIYSCQ